MVRFKVCWRLFFTSTHREWRDVNADGLEQLQTGCLLPGDEPLFSAEVRKQRLFSVNLSKPVLLLQGLTWIVELSGPHIL